MKRCNSTTSVLTRRVKTSAVITGRVSIAAFAISTDLSVAIVLSETSLLSSLATAVTKNPLKYSP